MDSMNCYFNRHLVICNNFVSLNFFLNFTGKSLICWTLIAFGQGKVFAEPRLLFNKDPNLEVSSKERPINLLLTTN